MDLRYDLHTHTTYSDGWEWGEMAQAAADAGLSGIGFTDHCAIGPDAFGRRERYDLVETFEARRSEFLDGHGSGIRIFDAAEISYAPAKESEIAEFLAEAEFEYVIGSVHFGDRFNYSQPGMADASEAERRQAVETYVDHQIALIESELFDVIGHLDLVQRSPELRGLMTRSEYERIAIALSRHDCLPELNAGRLDRAYGTVHPPPEHLDLFAEREIPFVIGTDAHAPDQLRSRLRLLGECVPDLPVQVVDVPPGVEGLILAEQ